MRTRRFFLLVVTIGVLAACGSDAPTSNAPAATSTRGATDTTATKGTTATTVAPPARIVSLSPTATEILFAIGAGSQVVAVDEQSTFPPEAPRTDLSGYTPNVEAIAGYRPDLVVIATDVEDLVEGLEDLGVNVIHHDAAKTLDDTYTQIQELGEATGRGESAEALVATMKADIAAALEPFRAQQGVTYYHELDPTYFTVTSSTFIGSVYKLFGLDNIADRGAASGPYPQLSAEYIISADPDVIFLADTKCCGQNAASVGARAGWQAITAVKTGAVVELDDDVASRWGPRVVDFVELVAARLQATRGE